MNCHWEWKSNALPLTLEVQFGVQCTAIDSVSSSWCPVNCHEKRRIKRKERGRSYLHYHGVALVGIVVHFLQRHTKLTSSKSVITRLRILQMLLYVHRSHTDNIFGTGCFRSTVTCSYIVSLWSAETSLTHSKDLPVSLTRSPRWERGGGGVGGGGEGGEWWWREGREGERQTHGGSYSYILKFDIYLTPKKKKKKKKKERKSVFGRKQANLVFKSNNSMFKTHATFCVWNGRGGKKQKKKSNLPERHISIIRMTNFPEASKAIYLGFRVERWKR